MDSCFFKWPPLFIPFSRWRLARQWGIQPHIKSSVPLAGTCTSFCGLNLAQKLWKFWGCSEKVAVVISVERHWKEHIHCTSGIKFTVFTRSFYLTEPTDGVLMSVRKRCLRAPGRGVAQKPRPSVSAVSGPPIPPYECANKETTNLMHASEMVIIWINN